MMNPTETSVSSSSTNPPKQQQGFLAFSILMQEGLEETADEKLVREHFQELCKKAGEEKCTLEKLDDPYWNLTIGQQLEKRELPKEIHNAAERLQSLNLMKKLNKEGIFSTQGFNFLRLCLHPHLSATNSALKDLLAPQEEDNKSKVPAGGDLLGAPTEPSVLSRIEAVLSRQDAPPEKKQFAFNAWRQLMCALSLFESGSDYKEMHKEIKRYFVCMNGKKTNAAESVGGDLTSARPTHGAVMEQKRAPQDRQANIRAENSRHSNFKEKIQKTYQLADDDAEQALSLCIESYARICPSAQKVGVYDFASRIEEVMGGDVIVNKENIDKFIDAADKFIQDCNSRPKERIHWIRGVRNFLASDKFSKQADPTVKTVIVQSSGQVEDEKNLYENLQRQLGENFKKYCSNDSCEIEPRGEDENLKWYLLPTKENMEFPAFLLTPAQQTKAKVLPLPEKSLGALHRRLEDFYRSMGDTNNQNREKYTKTSGYQDISKKITFEAPGPNPFNDMLEKSQEFFCLPAPAIMQNLSGQGGAEIQAAEGMSNEAKRFAGYINYMLVFKPDAGDSQEDIEHYNNSTDKFNSELSQWRQRYPSFPSELEKAVQYFQSKYPVHPDLEGALLLEKPLPHLDNQRIENLFTSEADIRMNVPAKERGESGKGRVG